MDVLLPRCTFAIRRACMHSLASDNVSRAAARHTRLSTTLVGDPEACHLPPERRRRDAEDVGRLLAAPVALAQRGLDRLALRSVDDVRERPSVVAAGAPFGGCHRQEIVFRDDA